jgi:LEA14-like dessication related protein
MDLSNFKWKHGYWFIIGGVLVGSAAGYHFYQQYQLLKNTSIKPSGFVANSLTSSDADISIKMAMSNQSSIPFTIRSQLYNVYINDVFVGAIDNPNSIDIAPEKSSDIWLNIKFNPMDLINLSYNTLKDLLLQNSNVIIHLQGTAKISTGAGLLSFNYPVDQTFSLADIAANNTTPTT